MAQLAQERRCPFCAEPILAEARKCRHCGEWLSDTSPSPQRMISAISPAPRQSGLATASLLLALLGGGLGAIPAVFLGYKARREIADSRGRLKGDGWALAGLVLGWIQIAAIGTILALGAIVSLNAPDIAPLSPDGEFPVTRVAGPVVNASAVKEGERITYVFTLTQDVDECAFYTRTSIGSSHVNRTSSMDRGTHTLTFVNRRGTPPVSIACA